MDSPWRPRAGGLQECQGTFCDSTNVGPEMGTGLDDMLDEVK